MELSKEAMASPADTGLSRRSFVLSGASLLATLAVSPVRAASEDLVVYTTTHPAIQAALEQDFAAITKIRIRSIRLASGAMAQRFLSEQKAGNYVCDVITLGNPVFFDTITKMGVLESVRNRASLRGLDKEWVPDDHYAMITAAPSAIGYNSKLLPANALGKGWESLLNPELKGSMLMTDPRSNENFVVFLAMLQQRYGDNFLNALGKQQLRLVPVTQQGVEQVGAGEGKIIFPCLPGNLAAYRGKNIPVALSAIPDPTFWMPFFAGVCKQSANKENAYKWFDYIFTDRAQRILCKDASVSPLRKVEGAIPYRQVKNPDFAASIAKRDKLFDLLNLPV